MFFMNIISKLVLNPNFRRGEGEICEGGKGQVNGEWERGSGRDEGVRKARFGLGRRRGLIGGGEG